MVRSSFNPNSLRSYLKLYLIEVLLKFEDIELTVSDIKNSVNYKDLNEEVKQ